MPIKQRYMKATISYSLFRETVITGQVFQILEFLGLFYDKLLFVLLMSNYLKIKLLYLHILCIVNTH